MKKNWTREQLEQQLEELEIPFEKIEGVSVSLKELTPEQRTALYKAGFLTKEQLKKADEVMITDSYQARKLRKLSKVRSQIHGPVGAFKVWFVGEEQMAERE